MISFLRFSRSRLFFLLLLILLAGSSSLAVYADGGAPQLAYVAGAAQGISVITISSQRVTRTIAIKGNPQAILLSLDGGSLYVTRPASGQIAIIDTSTGKTRCTASLPGQPSLLALSLDTTILYVAGQGDTRVRALNPQTCAVLQTFETHEPVYGLAVAASTAPTATPSTPAQLWIAGTTALTIFDAQGHLLGTVPVPGGPQHISIPAGFTAYVTTRQGTVLAVDLYTRKIFHTLLSGGQFGTMDYDATTGEVYVPDEQHNRLDVLVPVTASVALIPSEPVRTIALSASPQSVAITSDGQLGFVALSNGQVVMLDIPGRSIIATIAVGGTPHFVITGLYPPAGSSALPVPPIGHSSTSGLLLPLMLSVFLVLACLLAAGALWFFWRRRRRVFSE